jgi:predicted TIM-barrel fold metal-dependent hydrolase
MDLLVHAIEDLRLIGVKFGPIYNRVSLDDSRLRPVYEYLVRHDLPLTLHMGVTYVADCPIDLGRPIHVDDLAMRYPDLKIIMAHMAHPWCEECVVTIRHAPNVYADISAIFYRPWQFYNALLCAQEYGVTHKLFWGTDFPYARVDESVNGLRSVNSVVQGTQMTQISQETIQRVLESNPFDHWWHDTRRAKAE